MNWSSVPRKNEDMMPRNVRNDSHPRVNLVRVAAPLTDPNQSPALSSGRLPPGAFEFEVGNCTRDSESIITWAHERRG